MLLLKIRAAALSTSTAPRAADHEPLEGEVAGGTCTRRGRLPPPRPQLRGQATGPMSPSLPHDGGAGPNKMVMVPYRLPAGTRRALEVPCLPTSERIPRGAVNERPQSSPRSSIQWRPLPMQKGANHLPIQVRAQGANIHRRQLPALPSNTGLAQTPQQPQG